MVDNQTSYDCRYVIQQRNAYESGLRRNSLQAGEEIGVSLLKNTLHLMRR